MICFEYNEWKNIYYNVLTLLPIHYLHHLTQEGRYGRKDKYKGGWLMMAEMHI